MKIFTLIQTKTCAWINSNKQGSLTRIGAYIQLHVSNQWDDRKFQELQRGILQERKLYV